jgi:hypothetical protein
MRLDLLCIESLDRVFAILEGYGKKLSFEYPNFHNDPHPIILQLGTYIHPNTKNKLVGAVNLNYMTAEEQELLRYYLPEVLKGKNLKDRYWIGRKLLPYIFKNFYRTYNSSLLAGAESGTIPFLTPNELSKYGKIDQANKLKLRRDALKKLKKGEALPPEEEEPLPPEEPPEEPEPEKPMPPTGVPPRAPEPSKEPMISPEPMPELPPEEIDVNKEVGPSSEPPPFDGGVSSQQEEPGLPSLQGKHGPEDLLPEPEMGGEMGGGNMPPADDVAKALVDELQGGKEVPTQGSLMAPPNQNNMLDRIDARLGQPVKSSVAEPKMGSGPKPVRDDENPDEEAGSPIPVR